MSAFMLTSTSGWVAAVMILATLTLPFFIRRMAARRPAPAQTYRARLQAHVWIGFAIVAACAVHVAASMTPAIFAGARGIGIDLATGAVVVVLAQAALGTRLNVPVPRAALRRFHLIGMILIVVLAAAHIAVNSPLTGTLLERG